MMSITDTNIIDIVGTTSDGLVILTISDYLDWSEVGKHLLYLQQKINTYIQYIESENIYENLTSGKEKPLAIRVYFKYEPKDQMIFFLE
ncbi:conserved hypothetical protein [Acinetobacter baylyi ADP1]|uniref:Uncharacterized protein n=2 Tax=Moraxellaceae TaxID=468 RepID=Q6FDL8_ACIAD|nr:conserved hypothetical protein [Acinetobacter baylyi ADP1]